MQEAAAPMKMKPLVVVGIPAYNEEKMIGRVVLEAMEHADLVIVCDDGSTDFTGQIASRLGADVVRHEKNMGYGMAIRTLFKRAREVNADILVTLDGDGQHDANEISQAVKPIIDDEADIVIGSRFMQNHTTNAIPLYRRAGIKIITKLTNNGNEKIIQDAQSGFRAYSRKVLDSLVLLEKGMGISAEILIDARKQGFRMYEVPVTVSYNNGTKTSTHNPVKHGFDVVGSVTKLIIEEKPLKVLGLPGMFFLAIGALFGVWTLQIYGTQHVIVTNIALAALGFVMIGFFTLSTAITLYAISRLAKKTNGKR